MKTAHFNEFAPEVYQYYTNTEANKQEHRQHAVIEHGILCFTPSYALARMRSDSLILGKIKLPKNTSFVDRSKKDFKKKK
jgi:hypothetical protein